MRVTVVGGGVIGVCCAYELARSGCETTLIEQGQCGEDVPLRNAGQAVTSLSAPIATPCPPEMLDWLFRYNSPFGIRSSLMPAHLRWLWHFARSASPKQQQVNLQASLTLAKHANQLSEDLRDVGTSFELYGRGSLLAVRRDETLKEAAEMYENLKGEGYGGEIEFLDGDSARRLEPVLSDEVIGALYFKNERNVLLESLVRRLSDHLTSEGVHVVEDTQVLGLEQDGWCGWRIPTTEGEYFSDRVLVAAGVASKKLLAPLGVRLLLGSEKYWSIIAKGRGTVPKHRLELAETDAVCVSCAGEPWVAEMFKLGDPNLSINREWLIKRVHSATMYLSDWQPEGPSLEWAGLRPKTPDGLPMIGAVPGEEGLYLASGHGTLGLTLAPSIAAAVARLIGEGHCVSELEPFRMDRF